jgi:hypothetical protein
MAQALTPSSTSPIAVIYLGTRKAALSTTSRGQSIREVISSNRRFLSTQQSTDTGIGGIRAKSE